MSLIPQTRDQTHAPCTGNTVLTTGLSGKSPESFRSSFSCNVKSRGFSNGAKRLAVTIRNDRIYQYRRATFAVATPNSWTFQIFTKVELFK